VLDTVAHTRVKTPTAAAEFLINTAAVTINHLIFLQDSIVSLSRSILNENQSQLNAMSKDLYYHSRALLHNSDNSLNFLKDRLKGVVKHLLEKERFDIQRYEHFVSLSLPENMLKRGYTITTRNGKTIKSISDIAVGEVIQTRFLDGEVDSKIIEKK
jgi:exodeoxyribonuclease VII large subunit